MNQFCKWLNPTLVPGESCNSCPTNKMFFTYSILYMLSLKHPKLIEDVNRLCPNLTVCPSCRLDDFSHFSNCDLCKKMDAIFIPVEYENEKSEKDEMFHGKKKK